MIWEIIFSSLLAAMVYVIFRYLRKESSLQDRKLLLPGELRELGFFETFNHKLFKANNYQISCIIIVNSQVNMDNFKVEKALQILAKRHPLLQAAITEVNHAEGKRYYFTRMPSSKVDYRQSEIKSTDPRHWEDAVTKELREPINDGDGPLWRCYRLKECVDSKNSKITNCFVFTFHHSIFDGLSMTMLFQEFLNILDKLHKNETVSEASYDVRPSCETLLAGKIRPKWWTRIYAKVLETIIAKGLYSFKRKTEIDTYFKKHPIMCYAYPDVRPGSGAIFTCLSKSETQRLLRACKKHKCTVNSALTAAASMAMADILRDGQVTKGLWIPSKYAIDCRRHIEVEENKNTDYLGLCALVPQLNCYVPAFDVESFTNVFWKTAKDITGRVHWAIRRESHLREVKVLQSFSSPFLENTYWSSPFKDRSKSYVDYFFVLSNFGRLSKVSNGDCLYDIEKMFICPGQHNQRSLFTIVFISVNERLCCSFTYFPHITAKSEAEDFNTKMLENLRRVIDEN